MKSATIMVLLLGLFLSADSMAQEPGSVPVRKIPGITAEDAYPRACVDCHVVYEERNLDVRLSTLLEGWTRRVEPGLLEIARSASPPGATLEGKHPSVPYALADMPSACMACHSKTADEAPPLGRLVHILHLTRGEANPFLTVFQGECTHCHKLDPTTGIWSIPSGPETGAP
jgi:hypothetical protein